MKKARANPLSIPMAPDTLTRKQSLQRPSALGYEAALLLTSLIWGSAFAVQQMGAQSGIGPITFTGLRFALGSLFLVPIVVWRARSSARAESQGTSDETRPTYFASVVAGLLLCVGAVLQQIGLQSTSAANSGFITVLYIVFVPVLGTFLGHKAPKTLWLGVGVCVVGLYLLSVGEHFAISAGDSVTLLAAVIWACQILVIDHAVGKGDPIQIACVQNAVCAVLSTVCGCFIESWSLDQLVAASGAIAYTGLVSVGVGHTLQVICQKRCPPAASAVIMSLESVFAAIAGYLLLGQTLTGRGLVGCLVVLAGVLITRVANAPKTM